MSGANRNNRQRWQASRAYYQSSESHSLITRINILIDRFLNPTRKHIEELVLDELASYGGLESHMEEQFLIAWEVFGWFSQHRYENDFVIYSQVEVTASDQLYRLDFSVEASPHDDYHEKIGPLKIAVEIDGHHFHERTKEQVALRDERDRNLQADGWTILHFSGSTLSYDPFQCVEQVWQLAQKRSIERK